MTKQEFISNRQAMTRSSNRTSVVFIVILFGGLLLNIPLAGYMDRAKPEKWIQLLYGIGFFGFLILNFPLLIWVGKRQHKRFRLECPNCHKPLVGALGQIAVASGACGHCGEPVFTDAKGRPEHVAGSTR
jgi:hypothetical protein